MLKDTELTEIVKLEDDDTGTRVLDMRDRGSILEDAAVALWALSRGVSEADLEDSRTRSPGSTLAEALVLNDCLEIADVAGLASNKVGLFCSECEGVYELGAALSRFELRCPACPERVLHVDAAEAGTARLLRSGVAFPGDATKRLTIPIAGSPAGTASADDQADDDAEHTAHIARFVGPYRLVKMLGKGGMGEVYAAHDLQGTHVALKLLALEDETSRRRFEREGQLLDGLSHPNIVGVLGRGVDEKTGWPFLALEYVRGVDLKVFLKSQATGRLSAEEATFIIERCARALAHAHDRGVIHRDVKLGNVLVTRDGAVKLSDFGISLAPEVSSVRLTLENTVIGTPHYLCPEVLSGKPWSPAADLYALGAFAFYLLAGRHAFTGDVLGGHLFRPAPDLKALDPEIPPPLPGLVARLLDKDAKARPTAAEVVAALADSCPDPAAIAVRWGESDAFGEDPLEWGRVPRPGQDYHHYRLEEQLGQGEGSLAFRATHMTLHTPIALKVLPAAEDDEVQSRFLRGAALAAFLNHPNVVRLLDCGTFAGTSFVAMEYVEGQPLEAVFSQDLDARLRVFAKICDGVHYAHTRGVIHRDLKSENIRVDGAGEPRILSFGLARPLGGESELTGEGEVLGTLANMPPEQARGQVDLIDVRSDVYALGGILYQLLTRGTKAIGAADRDELIRKVLSEVPPPPSAVVAERIPPELDAICLKALEKAREDRFASVLELEREIQRFRTGEPIASAGGGAGYRAGKWLERNWRELALFVTLATLLLLALTIHAKTTPAGGEQAATRAAEGRSASLRPGAVLATGLESNAGLLVDLDRDGDLDLATFGGDSTQLQTWLCDAEGRFARGPASPLSAPPLAAALADMDRDGSTDLLLAGEDGVEIRYGAGDGGWRPQSSRLLHDVALARLAVGDLDRDAVPEVVALPASPGRGLVVFQRGAAASVLEGLPTLRDLALADWNRDGADDVVVLDETRALLVLGDGRGGLREGGRVTLARAVGAPAALAVGDLDLDGWPDAVVVGAGGAAQILRGVKSSPYFVAEDTLDLGSPLGAVRLVDLDRDGDLDLVLGSARGLHVIVNTRSSRFGFELDGHQQLPIGEPGAFTLGDVDRDGDMDVVVLGPELRIHSGE